MSYPVLAITKGFVEALSHYLDYKSGESDSRFLAIISQRYLRDVTNGVTPGRAPNPREWAALAQLAFMNDQSGSRGRVNLDALFTEANRFFQDAFGMPLVRDSSDKQVIAYASESIQDLFRDLDSTGQWPPPEGAPDALPNSEAKAFAIEHNYNEIPEDIRNNPEWDGYFRPEPPTYFADIPLEQLDSQI